jgi:two-component system, OmpR family, response regulator ChvI
MTTIAIVEDDAPVSAQFAGWLKTYDSTYEVDQLYNRQEAEAAFATKRYDLVLMDIELLHDQTAGVGLIKQIMTSKNSCPVIVISGMPADVYRAIMLELAWDYLQKPADRASLVALVRSTLKDAPKITAPSGTSDASLPKGLELDPLQKQHPSWNGKRLIMPMTAQRILHKLATKRGRAVALPELMEAMPYRGSEGAVKTHINTIRSAFKDVDPSFDKIVTVPLMGYLWQD